MMDHLDDGTMMALLDGELPGSDADAARAHIGRCPACEGAIGEMRAALGIVESAFSALDRPALAPNGRIEAGSPPRGLPRRTSGHRAALPRAAVFLMGVAAAAAAAVPGSPVRDWLEPRLGGSPEPAATSHPPPELATTAAHAPETGIGVAPLGGRFRVVVSRAAPSLQVRAIITPSVTGGAYAVGDALGTRFSGRGGVVEVFDAAGDELRVEFPVAASDASLEIDGRTYVVKDGDHLRLIGGGADLVAEEVRFEVER